MDFKPEQLKAIVFTSVLLSLIACTETPDKHVLDEAVQGTLSSISAPVAKKIPFEMSAHGDKRTDNYYWMRDDSRSSQEVLAHLAAENTYADAMMANLKPLQDKIFNELVNGLEQDYDSVPAFDNGYWYYSRYEVGAEYPIYARKNGTLDAPEEVVLDVNKMAMGKDYYEVGDYVISPNNTQVAYSTDELSRELYSIEFKNLAGELNYADKLLDTDGEIVWANDNQTIFYVAVDPQTMIGKGVYRHKLGSQQSQDVLVYEEADSTFNTSLGKTKDGKVIFIYHDSTLSKGASLLDANHPTLAPKPFLPREDNHEYSFSKLGNYYYILTNWKAQNFRLMKVHKDNTQDKTKWQEVVAHRSDVLITDFVVFKDHLVVELRQKGQSTLLVGDLAWTSNKKILFDDDVYVTQLNDNYQQDTDLLRVEYSSPTTPASIYDIQLNDLSKTLKKQDKVPGSFHSADYEAKRIDITARDGNLVPVTLIYRKDKFKRDGTMPLFQNAYGAYGHAIEPRFRSYTLPLLDRGFVIAFAHVRGGQMLGRAWYEDGKMLHKRNTFTDFIDVTKSLVKQGYADKNRVFAMGTSAGGLLIGAVMNMAPELYKGVIAHVPFVDVITTMSDPSIPLTTSEYDEWGNPENKADYDYMLSYSPYDQVKAMDYPNMMVTSGLHDSRVLYFEPMKWVAKLRELKTNNNILLFKTDMQAGHGGASGRISGMHEIATDYAFIIHLADVKRQ